MSSLADEIASVSWYHTLDLGCGQVTPGRFDIRHLVRAVPIPDSLVGMRCLDIGTADGFWAFEMERRGAREVMAIDLDDPVAEDHPGDLPRAPRPDAGRTVRTFDIASRALGSHVERRNMSVYDLDPTVVGRFDFVFIGSLLLHLRDPVMALAAARTVTRGRLLSFDVISLGLSLLRPRTPAAHLARIDRVLWWTPNIAGHRRFLEAAGFRVVGSGGPLRQFWGEGFQKMALRQRAGTPFRSARFELLYRLGIPTHWVIGEPLANASLVPSRPGAAAQSEPRQALNGTR